MTIMPSESLQGENGLTWKELQAITFSFNAPFKLYVEDGQVFLAEQVVRVLPERRLVAFGVWQGKPAVAKLFFHTKHAKRHMREELSGIKTLRENEVPTPVLYYQGVSNDHHTQVLIFERIEQSYNLETIWNGKNSAEECLPLLKLVMVELATQHVLGVLQRDLHLRNFLLTKKKIYTLDGAQIDILEKLIAKKPSMESVALFLSQLGVGVEELQEKLFKHYAKSRGWLLKKQDMIDLAQMIKKCNYVRWRRFAKKIFRDSSSYACIHYHEATGMYDRAYTSQAFMQLLHDPEMAFKHPSAKILKSGRSATVVKIAIDQHVLVVKRYNLKNTWHRLRRCLRTTRAATSWRLAHKLSLFGVATARPVAFIEKNRLGLRGKSYYITEYVAGEHADAFFIRSRAEVEKTALMVQRVTATLKNLHKLEITHGDLKMTNMLIDAGEQPVLIDLDGAAEHVSMASLRAAWSKDITRFLQNFRDQPSLQKQFQIQL